MTFGAMSLIGILLGAVAYHVWSQNHHLKTQGLSATGTVIGYHSQEHYNRKRHRHSHTEAPIVRFIDAQGQVQTVTSDVYTSPPRFRTGERVRLWYTPNDPEKMLLAGTEEWLLTLILGGTGGLLTLAGIPNFLKSLLKP